MKKHVLLLASSLLLATASQAQWVRQPFTFERDHVPLYADAVDNNTAWFLASGRFIGENSNQVARTFNGGQDWTVLSVSNVNPATQTIQSLSAVSATTAWIVTLDGEDDRVIEGRVLKTVDAGNTWTVQNTGTMFRGEESWPNTIHFFNANDGVVMGDPDGNGEGPEIYYTANGGTTWTRSVNVPVGTSGEYGTFFPPATVGNSIWFANDEGDIFRSADKGVTWSVARDVAADPIETIAFRDERNGLAMIARDPGEHTLYQTADAGVTWAPLTYTGPLRGVSIDNVPGTGNYLSVGLGEDAGSSYSRDNGLTWVEIENTRDHLFLDAASPTAVWSGVIGSNGTNIIGGGAYRLTSTVLPTRAATLVLGASLVPNPSADGRFRVQWPTAAHSGPLTLTVFDAVGRQVQQQTLAASRVPETMLDLSQQKAGLYQVKLESAAGVSQLRAQVL